VVKAVPLKGWKLTKWTGACKGSQSTCSLRLSDRWWATVTFAPPGDFSNPYPVGRSVLLYGDLLTKVNSVTIDADAQVEAVPAPISGFANPPPPAGAQYTLVNVSVTFTGAPGSGGQDVLRLTLAVGRSKVLYEPNTCTPPDPSLQSVVTIYQDQPVIGNACYEIASKDAKSLRLMGKLGNTDQSVYLALH
jgi:hypothetical protein